MRLTPLYLAAILLTACASIDSAAEAAKLEAAAETYRECISGRMIKKQGDVDLYCRSARIGLYQTVLADPRSYNKSLVFEELAKNAIAMARDDFALAKDAAH